MLSDNSFSDVSIVIPTKDRSVNILRLIDYYSNVNFSGHIIIGDGTNYLSENILEKRLSNSNLPFKLLYYNWPSFSESSTTLKLLDMVTTNYVAWSGDDDFYTLSGIKQSVDFLSHNNKYISVHGDVIIFDVSYKMKNITSARFYNMYNSDNSDPLSRLYDYLHGEAGDPFYAVHRTTEMKNNYKYGNHIEDHILATGELPALMAVLQGPCAKINGVSLVRTSWENHRDRKRSDLLTKILNEKWTRDFAKMKNILVNELIKNKKNASAEYIEEFENFIKTRMLIGLIRNQLSYFLKLKRKSSYYKLSVIYKMFWRWRFSNIMNKYKNKFLFISIRNGTFYDYSNIKPIVNSINNFNP